MGMFFGGWLKDELTRQGVSQRDLVARTGKTEAHISKIIHGAVMPSWGTINMIVEAMGCEIEIRKKDEKEEEERMYDRPMPTIREQMERIVGLMCDEYCKWPEKMKEKNRENMEEAQDELLERYCAKCPMNRIS